MKKNPASDTNKKLTQTGFESKTGLLSVLGAIMLVALGGFFYTRRNKKAK